MLLVFEVHTEQAHHTFYVPGLAFSSIHALFDLWHDKAKRVGYPIFVTIRTDYGCYYKENAPYEIFKPGEDHRIPLNPEAKDYIRKYPLPTNS